jgi:hypothetical protein
MFALRNALKRKGHKMPVKNKLAYRMIEKIEVTAKE